MASESAAVLCSCCDDELGTDDHLAQGCRHCQSAEVVRVSIQQNVTLTQAQDVVARRAVFARRRRAEAR